MKLAWRFLRSDLRSGELQLLVAALLLSITLVTGLTAFVERLQVMLEGESSQLLAADRALRSSRPVDDSWLQQANQLGLQQARHLSFQSMLYAGDEPQLVSVKAATEAYPLKGRLSFRRVLRGNVEKVQKGPQRGEIWAEARLFDALGVSVGDRVLLGDAELTLAGELVAEPDRGAGAISMGPRVLMQWQDIDATGVVRPGSRLRYQYLFAGSSDALKTYEAWLLPRLTESQRWLDLNSSQPTVALALKRAKHFFLLASSIVLVLASVAVAMASSRYSQRHVQHVAVLKTLGARTPLISRIFLMLLGCVLLLTLLSGWMAGYLLQHWALARAIDVLELPPPPLSARPFLLGLITALISLFCFTLPPLWQLRQIPAVHIFQRLHDEKSRFHGAGLFWAVMGLLVLVYLYSGQLLLALLLLISLLLILLLAVVPAWLLLGRMQKLGMQASSWTGLARANIRRHLFANAVHVAVLAVSLMLLVVLWGVRDNLFSEWQQQLPEKTPNFFLVNVAPDERGAVKTWLDNNQVATQVLYPMVRGRLVAINDKKVSETISREQLKRAGVDRELNLSWSAQLPVDNRLTAGSWWTDEMHNGVSVESRVAERLDIQLGDKLTFDVAAESFSAEVTSFREVDWDRMRPNFYLLFQQQTLNDFAKTYMTSFWLPDAQHGLIVDLLRQHPTLVVIELDTLIKQIRGIIKHVSLALEFVLLFVIIGALLVMVATVQTSLDQRLRENTVIRALGGTRQLIQGGLLLEFAILGVMAGILATLGSEVVLLLLQQYVLHIDMQLHPQLWWFAPVAGMLLVTFTGFISARRVLNVSPVELLREL